MSIFGQHPADIVNALLKSENLGDIPDKELARQNLGVPSKDEVLYSGVPIGMILPYFGNVAPAGYLPCYGQTVNATSFPDLVQFLNPGQSSATIPDLRGEFIRGWDSGRGVDIGRELKSHQADAFQSFVATLFFRAGSGPGLGVVAGASGAASTGGNTGLSANTVTRSVDSSALTDAMYVNPSLTARTAEETRPRNVAALYCIKAFDAVQSYTSSLNLPGLVSDYSTLNAAAVKYADFLGGNQTLSATSGFQKLPGGLIVQWGHLSAASNSTSTITLPLAFPNSFSQVCISVRDTVQTGTAYPYGGAVPLTLGSFSLRNFYTASGLQYSYWAVGY